MRSKLIKAITLVMLGCGALGLASPREASAQQDRYGSRYGSIEAGTPIQVRLDTELSTQDIRAGEAWTGTVARSVVSSGQVVIPTGSPVRGIVTIADHGTHETAARLDLEMRSVTVDGRAIDLNADTEPIVAGSHRAKKIGAIAGGAAVGALLGRAVTKDSKGTLIGGLLGGAAGYGLTRNAFRTLKLNAGTVLDFSTVQSASLSAVRPSDAGIAYDRTWRNGRWNYRPGTMIPEGTAIRVRLNTPISTATAQSGDVWNGTVARAVVAGGQTLIPAGSPVRGVVTVVAQGGAGHRAWLRLSTWRVNVDGRRIAVNADTEPIVAPSTAPRRAELRGGSIVEFFTNEPLAVSRP